MKPLAVAPQAASERQVVLTDDFGQHIEISREQLDDLIAHASSRALATALSRLSAYR